MAAGWRWQTRLAWRLAPQQSFWSHPLAQLREHGAVAYSEETEQWEEETVYRACTHTTTKRPQVCGSRDKELRSSRSVTAANEIQPRPFAQGLARLDAGISAAARVHGRYHVITMYNPQTPFIRLHVPIREECCEIGHVCFGCASVLLLSLLLPSPHASSFLSAEEGGAQNVAQTCRWRFIIPRLRLAPPVPYTL